MAGFIITIDGPAGSGKSTVARLLAEKLGASFLDTGAMYRAVTLAAIQDSVDMANENKLLDVLQRHEFHFAAKKNEMTVHIDGVDVTEQIREPEITANAHYIASANKLREKLVQMQREFAAGEKRIITEGRDQGTVAFPNADMKFYLTADVAERARRRQAELQAKGIDIGLEQIQNDIAKRDASDERRTVGPLKPAVVAIIVDTTSLNIEEVVEKLLGIVGGRNRKEPAMRWFRFARMLCRIFCKMFFHIRFVGLENIPKRGAFVLVGNHQSFLDPVLCGICIGRCLYFLARDTLFKGLFGWLISSVNTIPVRRGEADMSAIRTVISKLKEGSGVCLFPEATRTMDGKISQFKPGFGLLCRRGNAAVVPAVIDGAFECWPRHKKIFSPGSEITVCYGKCIPADEIKKMSDEELAERLTDTLRRMQNECRIKEGKEPYNYDTHGG